MASVRERVALTPEAPTRADVKAAILDELLHGQGRLPELATRNDWYLAIAHVVRDLLLRGWVTTLQRVEQAPRAVAYLSAEFLIGPQLENHLLNLDLHELVREATAELDLDLDAILAQEEEPGLGNGGLGRLAACFLDSLATLEIPAIGYGIRYEFGIFDQAIRDGWQIETTDNWLRHGNPWEMVRTEVTYQVGFGGRTEWYEDERKIARVRWIPERVVRGMACDMPVSGYHAETVGLLRLWKAEACEAFDLAAFGAGDYYRAVEQKVASETLSKVLYPNDEPAAGKRLRLEQQYFFVACSLQDMLRILLSRDRVPESVRRHFAVQLNDTHPSIAVAELMRLLIDVHTLDWDEAWSVTRDTLSYTNHTLLPEALETWPLELFESVLPRHLEIIREINRRFLDEVRARFPSDEARAKRMSIVDEDGEKRERRVHMAHLATWGSHAVNGVAELHTRLLVRDVLQDFHELEPAKFVNVTNGVTPRRWIALANPALAQLITERIGPRWITHAEEELVRLEAYADEPAFLERWRRIKNENKQRLAELLRARTGVVVDPHSLFDVQVKRIHEYKRQHLNALHVVALYERARRGDEIVPRTFVFGGKSAPGYRMAKLIIRLIHGIAEVVNSDPATRDRLRVVFFPDFNVRAGERIYPAADLSEQISTAGKEASGTGNMKFAMNGALTIGTLDGANVEIRDAVGAENFFLFGLDADEVRARRASGYDPRAHYEREPELRTVLDLVAEGRFSRGDRDLYRPLLDALLGRDEYFVLADFAAYAACQKRAGEAFADARRWERMSVLNAARVGRFSSDRSIREYAQRVWRIPQRAEPASRRKGTS
jgi:starch phosphorylase